MAVEPEPATASVGAVSNSVVPPGVPSLTQSPCAYSSMVELEGVLEEIKLAPDDRERGRVGTRRRSTNCRWAHH